MVRVNGKMTSVTVECQVCNATGLSSSYDWPQSAIVCNICDGSGHVEYYLRIFEGRRKREDVSKVYMSSSHDIPMSYEEFLKRVKE